MAVCCFVLIVSSGKATPTPTAPAMLPANREGMTFKLVVLALVFGSDGPVVDGCKLDLDDVNDDGGANAEHEQRREDTSRDFLIVLAWLVGFVEIGRVSTVMTGRKFCEAAARGGKNVGRLLFSEAKLVGVVVMGCVEPFFKKSQRQKQAQ